MAVMFVSGGGVIGLPLKFLGQLAVCWTLGRAVSWFVGFMAST